jgi:hypothetical protein
MGGKNTVLILLGLVERVPGAEIGEGDPAGAHLAAAVLEPAAETDEIVTTKRGVTVNANVNANVNDNVPTGDHVGEIVNLRGTAAVAVAQARPVQAVGVGLARLVHRLEAIRVAAVAVDRVVVHLVHLALPRRILIRLLRQQRKRNRTPPATK